MEGGSAIGLGLDQGTQIELQPDGEQEQDHTEVGDQAETREGGGAEEVEQEPGAEEADERWNAQLMCDQTEREGDRDGDDDLLHAAPPWPLLRRVTDRGCGALSPCA